MILSVSRRTDVPAFYGEWFLNRLKEGFVCVRNPMNSRQISRVELTPGRVEAIVFWTKNPAESFLEKLNIIEEKGYRFYFQFTLTPYGAEIEPGLPPKKEICGRFRRLARQIGRDKVVWRYDPILFNDTWTPDEHRRLLQIFLLFPFRPRRRSSFTAFTRLTTSNSRDRPERPYAFNEGVTARQIVFSVREASATTR